MLDPYDILRKIAKEGITSVLIEGGRKVHQSFIKENLIDEIYVYTSNKKIEGAMLKTPFSKDDRWIINEEVYLEEDLLTIMRKKEPCLQES